MVVFIKKMCVIVVFLKFLYVNCNKLKFREIVLYFIKVYIDVCCIFKFMLYFFCYLFLSVFNCFI